MAALPMARSQAGQPADLPEQVPDLEGGLAGGLVLERRKRESENANPKTANSEKTANPNCESEKANPKNPETRMRKNPKAGNPKREIRNGKPETGKSETENPKREPKTGNLDSKPAQRNNPGTFEPIAKGIMEILKNMFCPFNPLTRAECRAIRELVIAVG